MAIQMNSWIAHSQHSHGVNSDSVTVHREQIRTCVKCLQNAPLKDSIISAQNQRIEIKDSIITVQQETLNKANETVLDLDAKLSDCKKRTVDLERKKKNGWKFGIPIGAVGGGFLGWLLGKNIK